MKGASSMQVGSAFPLLHCPPGLSADVIHLRIQGPQTLQGKSRILPRDLQCQWHWALSQQHWALSQYTYPGGMTLVPSACLGRQLECAQCSFLNKSVNKDLLISKGACDQSIFNVTGTTLSFFVNVFLYRNFYYIKTT